MVKHNYLQHSFGSGVNGQLLALYTVSGTTQVKAQQVVPTQILNLLDTKAHSNKQDAAGRYFPQKSQQ